MEREYTPVVHFGESSHDNLMLMIKIYPQGKMTQHIDNIGVGTYIFFVLHDLFL